MQFTHEANITVDVPARDVWAHWTDVHALPRYLTHLRATAACDEEDLVRLVIVLDGRHLEFAAQRTMCSDNTVCWQSLGPTFLYVLTVSITPDSPGRTIVAINVAYDPPGFLPDIAESLGRSKTFRRTLETDLRRYAKSLRRPEPAFALAD